jgi:hypothetical protein
MQFTEGLSIIQPTANASPTGWPSSPLTRRPEVSLAKPTRIEDDKVLDNFRNKACVICRKPSDPAHIKSRGSGGPDAPWNVICLCRKHHTEQHQIGWRKFAAENRVVAAYLQFRGWYFDENGKLRNKALESEAV